MRKIILFLSFVAASAVFANSHMEMKPNAKLREIDYFGGNWSCKGNAMASPMAAEHATEASMMAKWQGGDYWLAFTYSEKKTDKNMMPFWVAGYMGYDAEQKKFAMGSVDNMGGYATSWSDGWMGDTMTFEGPWHMGNAMTTTGRDVFVKKSATSLVHWAAIEDHGKWVKLDEETCTKM